MGVNTGAIQYRYGQGVIEEFAYPTRESVETGKAATESANRQSLLAETATAALLINGQFDLVDYGEKPYTPPIGATMNCPA